MEAGVSKLAIVEFARIPCPVLLKEPAHFWDEIFISNEAYILNEVTHPRIRKKFAYDAGSHRLFLEYIDATPSMTWLQTGVTLQDLRRRTALRLMQCVAETIWTCMAAFQCGRPIVHNDLKSMNVLVPTATPQESLLIDFSHSYFSDNLPPFIADAKQDRAGTAKYMAPEKWDGNFEQGFKSDVFAFGVLAYYACTGKYPFEGDATQVEQQIREVSPASPLSLASNVLRTTAATIMSCLEKQPNGRAIHGQRSP